MRDLRNRGLHREDVMDMRRPHETGERSAKVTQGDNHDANSRESEEEMEYDA